MILSAADNFRLEKPCGPPTESHRDSLSFQHGSAGRASEIQPLELRHNEEM